MGQTTIFKENYLMSKKQEQQINNPLHGIKLVDILYNLVSYYGFEELGNKISIRCFTHDPSINSSLKFLRKTPWARAKVEQLYLKNTKPKS